MDSGRGRHSFRAYKATSPHSRYHENNHCNTSSNHPIFKSRIQRHALKWRRDYYHRGTHRSTMPYRKNDSGSKKPNKNTEDEEEEERKKKLNDTARKLLSKIKSWNAEKNCSEDDSEHQNYTATKINEVVSESGCKHNEADGKPKRIAHSKKTKLVKNRTRKSFNQPAKTVARYDVNKETVKDFQNRIQHKLIEELMQMPKENLQNVLNDPKINPIMEKKMSRLVRENKPLIAQKLRALAESKMKLLDYPSNPLLLEDIDKLIDPVIETDLSVLPYELIKQMENIFQVQFDYSESNSTENCQGAIEEDIGIQINNLEQDVKPEGNEDLNVYECSTDEDEEISVIKSLKFDSEYLVKGANKLSEQIEGKGHQDESFGGDNIDSSSLVSAEGKKDTNLELNQYIPVTLTSTSCQTDYDCENASTQTEVETLYGIPIQKEATDESISSLLNELNSIQILSNKLNERRLMIFLQLARMNPSGSFISDDVIKNSFIESISNGDVCLVESLKQFFLLRKNKGSKSGNENGSKSGK